MNNYQNRVGFFPKTALNLQSCDGEQKIKSHLAMIHLWAELWSARLEFYCCCEFTELLAVEALVELIKDKISGICSPWVSGITL